MKGVLRILAIFALAAITKADVIEFTQEAFNNLHITTQGTESFATMINSRIQSTFILKRSRAINEIKLKSDDSHLRNQAVYNNGRTGRPMECGNYHGININDQLFCRITLFSIKAIGARSQPQTMYFHLYFREPSLVLEVPIFQIPSQIPGVLTEQQLRTWADRNRVGLEPPFESDNLLTVQNRGPLMTDFEWLEELLTYGISKSVHRAVVSQPRAQIQEVTTYVTRPLLLSKDFINSCLNAMESLNLQGYESSASNSPASSDSSDDEERTISVLDDEASS